MRRKNKDGQGVRRNLKGLDLVKRIAESESVAKLHWLQGEGRPDETPLAPAYYAGRQKGTDNVADFDLYILTEEISGYVQWSTVSGRTLEVAGFRLPPCIPNLLMNVRWSRFDVYGKARGMMMWRRVD